MRELFYDVKPEITIEPQLAGAGTINGDEVDTKGDHDLMLVVETGVDAGTPTSFTVDVKLQESDTSGSGFTDITGAAITQITTEDTIEVKGLQGVGYKKRYIRAVATVAFVGGSTPTIALNARILVQKKASEPVNS